MTKQISAKLILRTRNPDTGAVATTYELEYPRFVHSEFMTHRLFSRNSASSRAIPVATVIQSVLDDPAMPVHWGKNQPGMQAREELTGEDLRFVQNEWLNARDFAANCAKRMSEAGAHKQIVNRILEPFQWMKVIATSTEWNNFYWLRDHKDADPTIKRLAEVMNKESIKYKPIDLRDGEWHLPYFTLHRKPMCDTITYRTVEDGTEFALEDAIKISASLCAQVSFRKSNFGLEKAADIYKRLIESEPVHASPVEHQLQAVYTRSDSLHMLKHSGYTHMDMDGNFWSGNIRGYVQHRQLIPNHVKKG